MVRGYRRSCLDLGKLCDSPQPDLREATSAYEPLLPIEKKLIGWSLGTGLALLMVLLVINVFVPLG